MNTNQPPSAAVTINNLWKLCGGLLLWLLFNPDAYGVVAPINGWDTNDFPCVTCPCPPGGGGPPGPSNPGGGGGGPGGPGGGPGSSTPGCNDCNKTLDSGMPDWRVSEPYIQLWIHDE